jgi:hypothetical protein
MYRTIGLLKLKSQKEMLNNFILNYTNRLNTAQLEASLIRWVLNPSMRTL